MNFDQLEQTWSRQLVVGAPISPELVQHALMREVRQRSSRVRRIMRLGIFLLVALWGTVAAAHYTGIKPLDGIAALYLAAATVFDVAAFAVAFLTLRRNRQEEARMGESVLEATRGALRATRRQIRDCVLFGYWLGVAWIGSAAFLLAKHHWNDFPTHGLMFGLGLDAVFVIAIGLTLRRYYRRNLAPRQHELREQLASLDDAVST